MTLIMKSWSWSHFLITFFLDLWSHLRSGKQIIWHFKVEVLHFNIGFCAGFVIHSETIIFRCDNHFQKTKMFSSIRSKNKLLAKTMILFPISLKMLQINITKNACFVPTLLLWFTSCLNSSENLKYFQCWVWCITKKLDLAPPSK